MDINGPGADHSNVSRFIMDNIEICETGENVVITGDLPPYEKVDLVTASVNRDGLRVFALLDQGSGAAPKYRACTFGDFARLFRLPGTGVSETLEAHVDGGFLRVLIPKKHI